MTDLIDRADSGEIPRYDDLGIEPTEDLRHYMNRRDTTGELTMNLAPEIAGLPPRRRPAVNPTVEGRLIEPALGMTDGSRVIDVDETVIYHRTDPQPPRPMPAPGPPPAPSAEDTAVHTILDSLAGASVGVSGELEGPQKPPPPLPKPEEALPGYVGRHRRPEDVAAGQYWEMQRPAHERRLSPWVLAALVAIGGAMWAGLILAAKVVFW